MTNKQIAEKFAEGATKGKASNDTLFIEGDTIYSYGHHFAIARRVAPNSYQITARKYSSTTSRHCSHVRMALHFAGATVEEVETLDK